MANRSWRDGAHQSVRHRKPPEMNQAVCVDVGRVFDSCSDRDCVEDLAVFFSVADQAVIDDAVDVRVKKASILATCIDVDELPLQNGCYSCKLTFFVEVTVEVQQACECKCTTVCGCTMFEKTVVLYGGESSVQVFDGEFRSECHSHCELTNGNRPRCQVQIAEPVVLETRLANECGCCSCCVGKRLPPRYLERFGGQLAENGGTKRVYVTLGVFTIVQLVRNAQMMVPMIGYCLPCKECNNDEVSPCDVFRTMSFPTEEFFPPVCKDGQKR
ncbi:MAG: hypothetical protein IJD01_00640 [Clostridia bacterium]|nr:hypothetical protein [Clostridia bacterium]